MFKKSLLVGAMTLGLASSAFCSGAVIPDVGIDVSNYILAGFVLLSGVVGFALGGFTTFLIVRKAFQWLTISLSDSPVEDRSSWTSQQWSDYYGDGESAWTDADHLSADKSVWVEDFSASSEIKFK